MKEKNISLQPKTNHSIIMENRRTMNISGITDVDSFDEKTIVLFTQLGELTIKGRELQQLQPQLPLSLQQLLML